MINQFQKIENQKSSISTLNSDNWLKNSLTMSSLLIEQNGRTFEQKSQQNNQQNKIKISESEKNQVKNTAQILDDHINPTSETICIRQEKVSERNPENKKKKWKVCFLVATAILILATIIPVVVVVSTKSKSNGQTNNNDTILPPSDQDANKTTTNDTIINPNNLTDNKSGQNDTVFVEHPEETYDLITLNSSSALCLDGTSAGYYLSRTGDPSKIYILFEGGAWCLGDDSQKTLQSCYYRSKSYLGSTFFQPSSKTYTNGILSNHSENYFKDWKKVLILYCDGSGHQGTRKDPVLYKNTLLYFRGHNNTVETFDDLQKKLGLYTKASKVVLSGESAGGVAMYTWTNYLKQKIQYGNLYAIADSAIFYHSEGNDHTTKFKQKYANLMSITNQEIDPPVPECIAKFNNEKENCMFVQNLFEYIQVPLFHIQFVNDIWSLTKVWEVACLKNGTNEISECTEEENATIEDHRKNVTNVLKKIAENPQNGVWGARCFSHAAALYSIYTKKSFDVPMGSNFTVANSISKWMQKPYENNVNIDDHPWSKTSICG